MRKMIISLFIMFAALNVSARDVVHHLESSDIACPRHLEFVEAYVAGQPEKLKITRDDLNDIYIPEITDCENVEGQTFDTNEGSAGSMLTCTAIENTDDKYEVRIIYEIPSKDPSDYGFKREYRIYKTEDGVKAYWGQNRPYDGAPIFCNYN